MRVGLVPVITGLCWLISVSSAAADWAISGFLGAVQTRPNTLTVQLPNAGTQLTLDSVRYRSQSFESPQYYGVRVTGYLGPHFGLEGEWIHPKAYARTEEVVHASGTVAGSPLNADVRLDSLVHRFSISHGLNYLLMNAVVRHPLDKSERPRGWLTARAGAGLTIPHGESDIGGLRQEQYEIGSVGFHFAAGGELKISRIVYVMAEYKFTTTDESVSVAGGTVDGRFSSHHIAFGIVLRP
jgi:opacity protein-like surface antigen